MKNELAIIGYGRFGRCAARHLRKRYPLAVSDSKGVSSTGRGIRSVSLEEAANHSTIILATPINTLPALLKTLAPLLKPGTLVCDVCSVKEQPLRWMKQYLPRSVQYLGTHPLFGPDSAATSLRARHIILCPGNIPAPRLKRMKRTLETMGLAVHITTPAAHDKLMASTLFLTQFIGHGLDGMSAPAGAPTTQNFNLLRQIVATTKNDSLELFQDMYRFNRYARTIPAHVERSFTRLHTLLVRSLRP